MNASSAAAVEGRRVAPISLRAVAGISVSGVGEREADGDGAGFLVFDDFDLVDDFAAFDGLVSDVFDFLVGGCCDGGDDSESDEDISDESDEEIGSGIIIIGSSNICPG